MTRRLLHILVLLLGLMVFTSCEVLETPADVVHPLDPTNPDFEPPFVVFNVAPSEGETMDTSLVTFEWTGNEASMNFSYRLDEKEWSEWGLANSISFEMLDEGDHFFELKSRYLSGVEIEEPQSISFEVDDLQPCSITFFPRLVEFDGVQDVSSEIFVHEVDSLAMVKAVIKFDPNLLEVKNVHVYESESILAQNGGTIIPFSSIDNVAGIVVIEVAVATGENLFVSGTGGIARLDLRMRSEALAPLLFDASSEYRTADNTTLKITDLGHGGVYAE